MNDNKNRLSIGMNSYVDAMRAYIRRTMESNTEGNWFKDRVIGILPEQRMIRIEERLEHEEVFDAGDVGFEGVLEVGDFFHVVLRNRDIFDCLHKRDSFEVAECGGNPVTWMREVMDWRNVFAHPPPRDPKKQDVDRVLDTIVRVLNLCDASSAEKVKSLLSDTHDKKPTKQQRHRLAETNRLLEASREERQAARLDRQEAHRERKEAIRERSRAEKRLSEANVLESIVENEKRQAEQKLEQAIQAQMEAESANRQAEVILDQAKQIRIESEQIKLQTERDRRQAKEHRKAPMVSKQDIGTIPNLESVQKRESDDIVESELQTYRKNFVAAKSGNGWKFETLIGGWRVTRWVGQAKDSIRACVFAPSKSSPEGLVSADISPLLSSDFQAEDFAFEWLMRHELNEEIEIRAKESIEKHKNSQQFLKTVQELFSDDDLPF